MEQTPVLLPLEVADNERAPAVNEWRPHLRWSRKYAKAMGITCIFVSSIAFSCNIGWLFVQDDTIAGTGVGFWAGALVFLAGMLMIMSGFSPTRWVIFSVLVMSVIGVVFDFGFIAVGSAQLANYALRDPAVNQHVYVGFGVLYIVIGVICFGLFLTASILSCFTLCSSNTTYPNAAHIPQIVINGLDRSESEVSLPEAPTKLLPAPAEAPPYSS